MSRTGQLIVPHYAGKPFVEKPPLYFAVAAGFVRLLGPLTGNTGAIRLTSAMWGLATIAMMFLLAKRIIGKRGAVLAACLLATMTGFVQNLHWIRVDAALLFFVTAAAWCFNDVYRANNRRLLPLGGLLAAGAFLVKGPIGLVLVFIVWTAVFFPWVGRQRDRKGLLAPWVFSHAVSLLVFVGLSASWVVALRVVGGKALWHEWFWVNQVGRLTGTATQLGHMRRGHPLYYVQTVCVYTLPWLPLVAVWFVRTTRGLIARRERFTTHALLLGWSLGAMLILTLSVTKRDIYLLPVLPPFAVMAAVVLKGDPPRWMVRYFHIWTALCIFLLAAFSLSPLFVRFVPSALTGKAGLASVLAFLGTFTWRHALATLCLAACLYLVYRRRTLSPVTLPLAATALLYIGAFAVPAKAIDLQKDMRTDFTAFVASIPSARRPRVAGHAFSETAAACFYYYSGWSVPQVNDPQRLQRILQHKDPEFDSLIESEPSRSIETNSSCRILAQAFPGDSSHKRPLYWVEGR